MTGNGNGDGSEGEPRGGTGGPGGDGRRDGDEGADPVSVVSFNVRVDTDADEGDRDWRRRRGDVAETLRRVDPDVVGLQEPLAHQFAYLREQLPAYDWVGEGRHDGDTAGEYGPVGYRASRFTRRDWSTFWLSEAPEEAGSTAWEAAWPRMVTWVELEDGRTGGTLYAFNTHLDHESERARREGASLLRARLDGVAGDAPAVVTGDMNCTADAEPYRVLTADDSDRRRGLRDAHRATERDHRGPTFTFDGFGDDPAGKRDYVLVTDRVTVREHGVVDRRGGAPPSDHLPVRAVVDLPTDSR